MEPIISRNLIEAKAREAFEHGADRDAHGFNWHAAAIAVWQAEWDRCEQQQWEQAAAEAHGYELEGASS